MKIYAIWIQTVWKQQMVAICIGLTWNSYTATVMWHSVVSEGSYQSLYESNNLFQIFKSNKYPLWSWLVSCSCWKRTNFATFFLMMTKHYDNIFKSQLVVALNWVREKQQWADHIFDHWSINVIFPNNFAKMS